MLLASSFGWKVQAGRRIAARKAASGARGKGGAGHMTNVIGDSVRALGDSLTVPLMLMIALVAFVALIRVSTFAWYAIVNRGPLPLVVRVNCGKSAGQPDGELATANDRLLAYLAQDSQKNLVIAPGVGGPAAPGVATEASEARYGSIAALLRLACARQPSYGVEVSWSKTGPEHEADVRISRVPGDGVVVAESFSESSADDLIQTVGCFCITFLRSQPRVLRRTPRWERWDKGIDGYRAYRRGLQFQHDAERPHSGRQHPGGVDLGEYSKALPFFDQAALAEPANLSVQLHRAALCELTGDYSAAVDIYQKSHTLWPEHIETAYRLCNASRRLPGHVSSGSPKDHFKDIEDRLSLWNLTLSWARTLRLWQWNWGDRGYWQRWLQLPIPGRLTMRAEYLNAIAISKLIAELSALCAGQGTARTMDDLMHDLARLLLRRRAARVGWVLLLHRELIADAVRHQHDDSSQQHPEHHGDLADPAYVPPLTRARYHRHIGWLASYNAACFFSIAMKLSRNQIPAPYLRTSDDWYVDCSRAAIWELGRMKRNPRHALAPGWLVTDPDLKPMLDSAAGKNWAPFMGLYIQLVSPAAVRSGTGGRQGTPGPGRR
jgi:hypothetical protein